MPKKKHTIIEYRNYNLPENFPILLLTGDVWRISDVPSGRLHFHNCLEIGLCHTDSGIMEFMNTPMPFHAGDVTVVASDIFHTTYSSPGTASKWSYLLVDVEELLFPYFHIETVSQEDSIRKLIHNFSAILPKEQYPQIYTLVHCIIETMLAKAPDYQFAVRGLILALVVYLSNVYTTLNDSTKKDPSPSLTLSIAPALDYIRKNYMREFPITILSELCNMSSTHFRRTFTEIMGVAPLEYLNGIRIKNASSLLRKTTLSILQISEEVGFRSLSSFNRHFIEIYETTPRDYRNHMTQIPKPDILEYNGWLTPPKQV